MDRETEIEIEIEREDGERERDGKESKVPTGGSHLYNIQYASWYRWLFINSNPQVLPIHTNSARAVPVLMDAVPLRGPAERRPLEERQPGKGNVTSPSENRG